MARLDQQTSMTIKNSPIPFIITTSSEGGRRVWVRSDSATLDLIGTEALTDSESRQPRSQSPTFLMLDILLRQSPRVNSISTDLYEPWDYKGSSTNYEYHNFDDRLARYHFVWRGYVTRRTYYKLETELKKRSLDISKAILNENEGDLEWHVSALVAICQYENKRINRLRKISVFFGFLYLLAFLGLLLRQYNIL